MKRNVVFLPLVLLSVIGSVVGYFLVTAMYDRAFEKYSTMGIERPQLKDFWVGFMAAFIVGVI